MTFCIKLFGLKNRCRACETDWERIHFSPKIRHKQSNLLVDLLFS